MMRITADSIISGSGRGLNFNDSYIITIEVIVVAFFIVFFGILFSHFTEAQEQGTINTLTNTLNYLNIDKISVGSSPTGLISVKGVVHNNSTANMVNIKVKVRLFGSNNNLVAETVRFVIPPSFTFKPGYERNFDILISASNVNHYNITAYGYKMQ